MKLTDEQIRDCWASVTHITGVSPKVHAFARAIEAEVIEMCAQECEHTAVRMGSEWMAHHCAAAIRSGG